MAQSEARSENILLSLGCNIALPALLLGKGDSWLPGVSPATILLLALAFPVGYFFFDLGRRRQVNMLSIIGFLGTLASGGLGLLKMDPYWIAIKEAAVPLLIGSVVLLAELAGRPLLRTLFLNETLLEMERINTAVSSRGHTAAFEKALRTTGFILAASFFFSAGLNFLLARWIVQTHPEENAALFNQELGRMTLWSWPVIVLPMSIVFVVTFLRLIKQLRNFSGLSDEEIFRQKK